MLYEILLNDVIRILQIKIQRKGKSRISIVENQARSIQDIK